MRLSARFSATEGNTFRPQLTSLVDVMAIILVFLIKSFSAEGNLITPSPDLELPISTSQKPPQPHWTIEIARNVVMSEGSSIASTRAVTRGDSLLIPELRQWLLARRKLRSDTSAQMILQCDKEVPYAIVKRVMYTCSRAGFVDFSVLVIREE